MADNLYRTYDSWDIRSTFSIGASILATLGYAEYDLTGHSNIRTDRFKVRFLNAGVGVSIGLEMPASLPAGSPDWARDTLFVPGQVRPIDLQGPAMVFEVAAAAGVGRSDQFVLFNVHLSATAAIQRFYELLREYRRTRVIRRFLGATAISIGRGPTVGAEVGVSAREGRISIWNA